MGFAYEEPTSDTSGDYSGDSTTTSVTTYEDYSENISDTDTSGGFATSDPYVGESYGGTSEIVQPTQGEHTYDMDYEPTETTNLDPMTGGTIAGGLGGTEEQQQEQVDAISDVTHTTTETGETVHTTDLLQGDPVETITAGETSAEDVWNDTTPDVPSLPSVPEFPDPRDPDGLGVGLLLAAAIALYIGFREVVGSGA